MNAILGALPYLVFLTCPLMMIFMMRGGHGHTTGQHADHLASPASRFDEHDATARIAALESEVARLRSAEPRSPWDSAAQR